MKIRRSFLSMLLCLTLVFSMCFAFSGTAYAAGEPTLGDGGTMALTEINKLDSLKVYKTPIVNGTSQLFTYYVNMPAKGTLFVQYAGTSGTSCYVSEVVGGSYYGGDKSVSNGVETKYDMYKVASAGKLAIKLRVYNYEASGYAAVGAYYAPATKKFSGAKTEFLLGSTDYSSISSFTVKVPAKGYLKVKLADGINNYGVYMKTSKFKGWQYVSSSSDTQYIGVKKGTYKIQVKGAKVYSVKTSFTKVKETSSKTTKKTAASIKKKKVNKGLIVTNKKKVHWYKIKNPKNQKMSIEVNGKKLSKGGGYGYLKITAYFPDGDTAYGTLNAGTKDTFKLTYGTVGTTKARAGTYWIKVESKDGANGYYTLKWK